MFVKLKFSKSWSNSFQVWQKFRYLLDGFNLFSQEFVKEVRHLQQGRIMLVQSSTNLEIYSF